MSETRLLEAVTAYAAEFLPSLETRPIGPGASHAELIAALGGPLPAAGADDLEVIASLIRDGESGVNAMPSGRFFGFVLGGSHPAALAADWLTSVWDQNAGLYAPAPTAAVVEEIAAEWLRELLGLPAGVSCGFVTGCQLAHVTCLAAARQHVLAQAGWDVNEAGMAGGPEIRVIVGDEVHVTRAAGAAVPRHRHALARVRALGRAGPGACRCAARRPRLRERSDDRRACRSATSTPEQRTRWTRSSTPHTTPAPGSTSTAPSGSGRPPRRVAASSSPASSAPTPGPRTVTSG